MRWAVGVVSLVMAVMAIGCAKEKPPAAGGGSAVAWLHEYEAGLQQAKEAGKPVMVDVFATWCDPCKQLDKKVFSRSDVGEASKQFVAVKVDGDKRPDLVKKLRVSGYPTTVFLTAEEEELGRVRGLVSYREMLEAMREARRQFGKGR